MVVLDTSIIIEHLRQSKDTVSVLRKLRKNYANTNKLCISVITVQELFQGQSSKLKKEEDIILSIVNGLDILPYTFSIARRAGEIVRDSLSTKVNFIDAMIAATSIECNGNLVTLNIKHFDLITGLRLIYPKDLN